MPQIVRPTKQGGATTYQGKVGAGYTTILASEMDADLDTIYSAWNTGVDGSNIRPGVITGGMLAPGAVGSRELADGGVQTVDIADAAVTTPKLADSAITPGKLPGGGVMGGDLTGTYPNPSLGVIQSGTVYLGHGSLLQASANLIQLGENESVAPGYDSSQPTWLEQLGLSDSWVLYRTPSGSTTPVQLLALDSAGKLHAVLADGSVTRAALAVNAIYGVSAVSQCPAGYSTASPVGSWFTYMTLSPITTRGAAVMLLAQHNLSCTGPGGGGTVAQRWLRGATPLQERATLVNTTSYVPLGGLQQFDTPAAGTYTYAMQLFLQTGCAVISPAGSTQGFLQALEIG